MLSWGELRVLLSEAVPQVPDGEPGRWERIALYVQQRCPGSPLRQDFLNFGYEGPVPGHPVIALRGPDRNQRLQIQLYQRLIGACPIEGRTVLEVGCGWGGGCRYIADYLGPRRIAGLDVVPANVRRCRAKLALAEMAARVSSAVASFRPLSLRAAEGH